MPNTVLAHPTSGIQPELRNRAAIEICHQYQDEGEPFRCHCHIGAPWLRKGIMEEAGLSQPPTANTAKLQPMVWKLVD